MVGIQELESGCMGYIAIVGLVAAAEEILLAGSNWDLGSHNFETGVG